MLFKNFAWDAQWNTCKKRSEVDILPIAQKYAVYKFDSF